MEIKDLLSKGETIIKSNEFEKRNISNYLEKFKEEYDVHAIEKIEIVTGWINKEYKHHYIVELYGGDNGSVNWQKYFNTLEKIFDRSEYEKTQIKDMWLIDLYNDCLDDVHNVYIGIRMND